MSFSEHLKQFRIGKAGELLARSPLPIALVAEKTGFSNLSNLIANLKPLKQSRQKRFAVSFKSSVSFHRLKAEWLQCHYLVKKRAISLNAEPELLYLQQ